MDLLTQGLVGGILAQSVARQQESRPALFIGFFAGLLADADILIRSSNDPLLTIEYHRHFTHSLVFVPIGALISALILYSLYKLSVRIHAKAKSAQPKKYNIPFKRFYLYSFLGFSLSGFIDACTSYGTHLFWPFYNERLAFNIISIIDPVFTSVLIICSLLAFKYKARHYAHSALLLCSCYLIFGYFQSQRAEQQAIKLAASRGHVVEKMLLKPTLGNLMLWRSCYIANNQIFVDGIRVAIFSPVKVYEGESINIFDPGQISQQNGKNSVLYQDILRFQQFSDHFIAIHPELPNVLGDIRYSMLANSSKPLWGIRIDKKKPDQHAQYLVYRENTPQIRKKFITMIWGN